MKLINLIPQQIKDERQSKKYKQIVAVLAIIPVLFYGQVSFSKYLIQKDIDAINDQISEGKVIEAQIKAADTALFNDMRIVGGLSNDSFPLHRFLLFLSIELPDDMRLYSVTTQNLLDKDENGKTEQEEKAEEAEAQKQTTKEVTSKTNTNTTNTDASKDSTNSENAQEIKDAEKQKEEEEKIQKMLTEQKMLYIRGATLSVNSIGEFMKQLQASPYIKKVDIQDIQNYYNGAESYKFFELTVEMK